MTQASLSNISGRIESVRSTDGGTHSVSPDVIRDSNTNIAATSGVTTINSPTVDLGVARANQRTLILGQYVQDVVTVIPNNITIEVQWSDDGTNWYVAPTSAQGDARTSTVTTGAADKTMITRGQVLARYFRVQIVTTAAVLGAGKLVVWHTRSP